MSNHFKFFNGSIYHGTGDFAKRCAFRRITFGYSIYAKKRISIFSRIRLIWTAFFTYYGRKLRTDYYFKKYLDREIARKKRYTLSFKTINHNDPEFFNIVSSVTAEKALLDKLSSETGKKYIN